MDELVVFSDGYNPEGQRRLHPRLRRARCDRLCARVLPAFPVAALDTAGVAYAVGAGVGGALIVAGVLVMNLFSRTAGH
jgi:hypothetical protein